MKFLIICLVCLLVYPAQGFGYPLDQFQECIASAKRNSNIADVPEKSIENYCDCALNLIVDKGQKTRESGFLCATKAFGTS